MQPDYSYTNIENAEKILQEILVEPSTIETVDTAIYNYINDKINVSSQTNEGFKKVPILWVGAERAFQIKNNPETKDEDGKLIFPIITIERKTVEKDPTFKGSFQAHVPDGPGPKRLGVPIARRIVQDKTSEFRKVDLERFIDGVGSRDPRYIRAFQEDYDSERSSLIKTFPRKNNKTVYQTIYAPIPTYVKVMYSIKIRTNYQTQMNDLTTPFLTTTGQINAIHIKAEGHRYEGFIEGSFSYSNNISNFELEERVFETNIDIRVLGYLMGEGKNSDKPKFSIVENIVQVRLPRERVITMDKNYVSNKSFYRD
jgi:hypothetical protein